MNKRIPIPLLIACIAGVGIFSAYLLPKWNDARKRLSGRTSLLIKFQEALNGYAEEHDGKFPYSPEGPDAALYLLRDRIPSAFEGHQYRWTAEYDDNEKKLLNSPYEYLNPPGDQLSNYDTRTILLAEKTPRRNGARGVFYMNGSIDSIAAYKIPQMPIVGAMCPCAGPMRVKLPASALDVIHSRKSVRTYTDEPVTDEQLNTLVRAAMAAPTAMNKQPWAFIIVTEPELCDALGEALANAPMCADAPAVIVVCGIPEESIPEPPNNCWMLDCSAATENLLLAAEATGLGAVWTAVYPMEENIASVRRILEIPDNVVPLAVVPVGHPGGDDKPKDKYKPEKIHHQKWNQDQN